MDDGCVEAVKGWEQRLDDPLASTQHVLDTVALGALPVVVELGGDSLKIAEQFISLEACVAEFTNEQLLALLAALRQLDSQRIRPCVSTSAPQRSRLSTPQRPHRILDRLADSRFLVVLSSVMVS